MVKLFMIKQASKHSHLPLQQEQDIKTDLMFITRKALTQIHQQLPPPAPHTYSALLYSHQEIFNLMRGLLTGSLPHNHPILPPPLLAQLTTRYAPSAILYAVLTLIFQKPIGRVNFQAEERHRFFLSSHPTRPTVILETFINILEEQAVSSTQQALAVLSRVEPLLQDALQQIRSEEESLRVTREEAAGRVGYRSSIIIDAAANIYQPNDLIYSSSADCMNPVFFEGLFQCMGRFGKPQAKRVVEELLLLLGTAVFLETALLEGEKAGVEQKRDFPMEMPFYRELACIGKFSLAVRFLSTTRDTTTLELAITFPAEVITVSVEEFQLRMQTLCVSLSGLTQKQLCVQNLVCLLDLGREVGQGSFGKVLRCQSIQLIDQQRHETATTRIFWFRRSLLAAKQLRLTPEQQLRLEIPANREHLILGMLGQLRHREMMKSVRRQVGMQTEEALVGVESIIPLLDCFRLAVARDGRGRVEHHHFLLFPLANASLAAPEFLQPLYGSPLFLEQVSLLFRRVFEGLSCLHFQVGRLYPHQLNRYYLLQNGDEGNSERDPLPSLVAGGKNGVCLRDVKPSNIVVQMGAGARVSRVWLIDFGMARIGELSVRSGATNCGSDYYMAPEVRQGGRQDERMDVWGAAVTLFEILGKGSRLYGSLEIHSMKAVHDSIQQRISQLVGDQYAWELLLKAVLAPRIEAAPEKTPIRLNSQQVVELMQREAWHLRGRPSLEGVYSSNRRSYLLREADGDVVVEHWEGVSEEHMKINQHCLRDLMRYAAGSPKFSLKVLLVCFYHAQVYFPPLNRLQLILFLASLHLLTLSSSNPDNFIVSPSVPPSQESRLDSGMLDDMQQTVFFGETVSGSANRPVVLATHIAFNHFSPNSLDACHQNTIKYFNGYCLSEQQNRMASGLYTIRSFSDVEEYTGKERLFATKTILGEVDVLFLRKIGQSLTPLQNVQTEELVGMANQIANFLIWQSQDMNSIITIDVLRDQIDEPNFAHLLRISRAKNQLKAAFSAKSLMSVLNGGGFCGGVKEVVRRVLMSGMKMGHAIRLCLCAYLKATSGPEFNAVWQKAVLYNRQEKLRQDLKQLLSGLSYIGHLPSPSFVRKGTAETARIVSYLHKLVDQQFSWGDRTTPRKSSRQFETDIRYFSDYCNLLLQMKENSCKNYDKVVNWTACLGGKVVEHLDLIKALLTN